MSFINSIILGIVEGITEFLPISSTAHLMMTSRALGIDQTEFLKSFEIIIQFGAIAALLFIFGRRLIESQMIWKKVVIAFIPTATIGFIVYKIVKTYLIANVGIAIWGLIVGGVALILIEYYISKKADHPHHELSEITSKQALIIGIVQSLAIVPGVSRSATTILSTLLFGSSRKAAAEFSFFLAIPTVGAAAGYDLINNIGTIHGNFQILAVGFVVSFIAAMISVKFLLSFVQKHSFALFGVYRIIIAVLFLMIFY